MNPANPEVAADPPAGDLLAQQPIARLHCAGSELVLLGTAHVSRVSAEAVRQLLAQESFDAVAVELCEHRARAIRDPDAVAALDLFQVLREGKVGTIAAGLALGAFQRRLAEQFGIEPGAEMRAAIDGAQALGLPCWLIDRDVGLTLRRTRAALGFWDKLMLSSGLLTTVMSSEEIAESEIEKLKQGDLLQSAFAEFAKQSAALFEALIAERDRYMAARLREQIDSANPRKILVVIGAGHLDGIARALSDPADHPAAILAALRQEPPPSRFARWFGYTLIALVLAGFAWGFLHSADTGIDLLLSWSLITASGGALGALAAGAHPLAILVSALSSPLTPLHPALSSGMLSGAVEAWLRKPRVADFQRLRDDVMHWRGWYRNAVTRVFLVFTLSNIGTAIAVWVAIARGAGKIAGQ
ncbi:MAG: TraB/GumN family protein [Lysobacterales bacterium]